MPVRFRSRADAGRWLVDGLSAYAQQPDVLVLTLPRGGVPVALEVALALPAVLDVFDVRETSLPGRSDMTLSEVVSGRASVFEGDDPEVDFTAPHTAVSDARRGPRESSAVAGRSRDVWDGAYRGNRAAPRVRGRVVIFIDDGTTPHEIIRPALTALAELKPATLVHVVPTAAPIVCDLTRIEDQVLPPIASGRDLYEVSPLNENVSWVVNLLVQGCADQVRPGTSSLTSFPTPGFGPSSPSYPSPPDRAANAAILAAATPLVPSSRFPLRTPDQAHPAFHSLERFPSIRLPGRYRRSISRVERTFLILWVVTLLAIILGILSR